MRKTSFLKTAIVALLGLGMTPAAADNYGSGYAPMPGYGYAPAPGYAYQPGYGNIPAGHLPPPEYRGYTTYQPNHGGRDYRNNGYRPAYQGNGGYGYQPRPRFNHSNGGFYGHGTGSTSDFRHARRAVAEQRRAEREARQAERRQRRDAHRAAREEERRRRHEARSANGNHRNGNGSGWKN